MFDSFLNIPGSEYATVLREATNVDTLLKASV